MIDYTKCASIDLMCKSENTPDVVVLVYGLVGADLRIIPDGSKPGLKALKRLKLDAGDYSSSLFTVKDVKLIKRS